MANLTAYGYNLSFFFGKGHMPVKRFRLTVLLLCVSVLLSGCLQEEDPLPDDESPIPAQLEQQPDDPSEETSSLPERFALPYEANSTLDPITCPDGMQQVVASLIYEGLFRLDTTLEVENCLCENWSCNDSHTVYTFILRPDAFFSDGSPLTAAEVRATLERARNSDRYRSRLRQIQELSASGNTLTVTLSVPNSGFPALLDVPICKNTGSVPLGTGPYAYVRGENGEYLSVNPYWWRGGGQPVSRMELDEAQGAMLYRFTSRDVQVIVTDLTSASAAGLTGDIRYHDTPGTVLQYIMCNTEREPLNNTAFRNALNRGIQRENLVRGLLSGHALAAEFPVSPASLLYPADLEEDYSAFAFSDALRESGYESGRVLTLLVNEENAFKVSVARSIAQSFALAGVPVTTRVEPWETYLELVAERDFDLCYCETRLSADWNLTPLVSEWSSLNISGWSDGRMSELLEAYNDSSNRAEALREVCAYMREQSPFLPVCFNNSTVLVQSEVVENLLPTAAEPFYNLRECVIHLREPET